MKVNISYIALANFPPVLNGLPYNIASFQAAYLFTWEELISIRIGTLATYLHLKCFM